MNAIENCDAGLVDASTTTAELTQLTVQTLDLSHGNGIAKASEYWAVFSFYRTARDKARREEWAEWQDEAESLGITRQEYEEHRDLGRSIESIIAAMREDERSGIDPYGDY